MTLSGIRHQRDYEMRTKTRRRHTIESIWDILAPNLSLVFKILIDCQKPSCTVACYACFAVVTDQNFKGWIYGLHGNTYSYAFPQAQLNQA